MRLKPSFTLAGVLIAGMAIGSVTTTALLAQNRPAGYVVAEVAVHDMDVFAKEYGPKLPATLQPYGGKFLVAGGKLTALEGDTPQRFVIIAFDSVDKARSWYDSPAYQELVAVRKRASTAKLFIAEGVPNN
jgi:uncharacterized protein (DUF1330 family)